jgi:hypothetical protein
MANSEERTRNTRKLLSKEFASTLSNFGPLSGPKLDKVDSGRNNYKNSA